VFAPLPQQGHNVCTSPQIVAVLENVMELTKPQIEERAARSAWRWPLFSILVAVEMWLAHAIGFFLHEYAHSTMAWLTGWKENPLAINYAHPSVGALLLQRGMSENVDYAPIFAAGRGGQAAIIAAAGMVIGNALITYPLSLWGIGRSRLRDSRACEMFFYWLCVASVGNFIDYVPVRTFADEDDMHTLARGLGVSPWWILVVLGVPAVVALAHLLFRLQPTVLRWVLPGSAAGRCVLVFLTAAALFGFYGASGISESDLPSHWMSVVSVRGMVPIMTLVGCLVVNRRNSETPN
jgi:hypothetical protein